MILVPFLVHWPLFIPTPYGCRITWHDKNSVIFKVSWTTFGDSSFGFSGHHDDKNADISFAPTRSSSRLVKAVDQTKEELQGTTDSIECRRFRKSLLVSPVGDPTRLLECCRNAAVPRQPPLVGRSPAFGYRLSSHRGVTGMQDMAMHAK
jgi:hypothetical protein